LSGNVRDAEIEIIRENDHSSDDGLLSHPQVSCLSSTKNRLNRFKSDQFAMESDAGAVVLFLERDERLILMV